MIKRILNSFVMAKKLEAQMDMLDKNLKLKDTYKVRITEEQINILGLCAMLGISTSKQLREHLKGDIKSVKF